MKTIDKTEAKVGDYIVFGSWNGENTYKILRIENGYFINASGIRFNVCDGKSEHGLHIIARYERDNDNMYAQVGDYTNINGDIYKVVYEHNGYCVLRGIKGDTIFSIKNKIVNIHSLSLEDRIETEIINVDSSALRDDDIIIYKDINDKEYIGTIVNVFNENAFIVHGHVNNLIKFTNGISFHRDYKIIEYKRCIIRDNFVNKVEIGDCIFTCRKNYIPVRINDSSYYCVEEGNLFEAAVDVLKSDIVTIHKNRLNLLSAEVGDRVKIIVDEKIKFGNIVEIIKKENAVVVYFNNSKAKFDMIDRYCIYDKKIRIIDCYKNIGVKIIKI